MKNGEHINIAIHSADELKSSFIPFLKKGGVIIPSAPDHDMGIIINLTIHLFNHTETFHIVGKVVWLTPESVKIDRLNGTGVEFIKGDYEALCKHVRDYQRQINLDDRHNSSIAQFQ